MSNFVSSLTTERARIRHFAMRNKAIKEEMAEFLRKEQGVIGMKTGYSSILLFMDENATFEQICKNLCRKFPFLKIEEKDTDWDGAQNVKIQANTRKDRLRELLTAGLTTAVLALTGPHKIHAWAGAIFALLASRHVCERRQRI